MFAASFIRSLAGVFAVHSFILDTKATREILFGRGGTAMSFLAVVLGVVVSAGLVTAAPSPRELKGDFTILINNDLQGGLLFCVITLGSKD